MERLLQLKNLLKKDSYAKNQKMKDLWRWKIVASMSNVKSMPGQWKVASILVGHSFFYKNGPTPASSSFIFVFSNTHYKFYNKYVCEKCPSNIWCWDSNSWPLEHESPPITTRQGSRHIKFIYAIIFGNQSDMEILHSKINKNTELMNRRI